MKGETDMTNLKIAVFLIPVLLFFLTTPNYPQEGDAPLVAWKWYYSPRAYPFDTIPSGAFENAVIQRKTLWQSTGYQFPGAGWQEIGPKPFGYGIGSSGRIHHVIYDPRDTSEEGNWIYVTGACGGLWKTENGGVNWQNKSGDLPSLIAGAFTLDAERNILYFGNTGTFNTWYGAGSGLRIFMSTNDGLNWTSISNGIDIGTSIYKIAISPNDSTGNTLFAATSRGLYKTTNGGEFWIKIIPRNDGEYKVCTDVCFSPDGSRVYAVGPSAGRRPPWNLIFDGIEYWRSDDGGSTFDPIPQSSGFPHGADALCERTLCAVSKASGAENLVWFISFDTLDVNVDVYKSINGGQNFTSRVVGSNGATRYQLVLRASDVDSNICFAGSQALYRTTNGGFYSIDWTCLDGYSDCVPVTRTHVDFLALDFNPFFPEKITVGNDGGVYRSDNLGSLQNSWVSCNQNLGSFALLWGLASSTYDAKFAAGGLHDYGYGYNLNTDSGSTFWYSIAFGADGGNMSASPFKSKHFLANKVYGYREIHFSDNGTLFNTTYGYAFETFTSVEVAPFTHHPTEPGAVYTVRYNQVVANPQQVQFRKSTNYGANWGGDATPLRQFQRPTNLNYTAPCFIAISQSNPNTMIMDFSNGHEFWLSQYNARSGLLKSTDGGLTWEGVDYGQGPIVIGGSGGTPNRAFTDVEFDPKEPNLLYLTVSGYYYPSTNQGHVFKSTDGGYNWSSISGNLPDIPVNDLIIHYTGTGSNDKELIIATDAGIYASNANDIDWQELASDFPNTPAFHLDYNRLSGKLRANTWGRGAWEFELDGIIYVQDHLYITDNVTLTKPIVVAPGGKLILGHTAVNSNMAITFNNDANIVVQEGGEIDASSGVAVNLTSSGLWGGIEFQGTGFGILRNITFQNTNTPVVINGGISEAQDIIIDNCTFSGRVSINNRSNVTVENSHWNYTSQPFGSIACVYSINSNQIDINSNELNTNPSAIFVDAAAISVISGESITIVDNNLNMCSQGIDVHNCSNAFVNKNIITSGSTEMSSTGISMDFAYSSTLRENIIINFPTGIYIFSSSPTLYINRIDNIGGNEPVGIMLANYSYPRLRPLVDEPYQRWDAGYNFIFDESPTNNQSISFKISYSLPEVGSGYNRIKAAQYYIDGCNLCVPSEYPWHAQYNCWSEEPPDTNKFHFTDGGQPFVENYTCGPPPGGGGKKRWVSDKDPSNEAEPAMPPDPQNIIVNRGNGVYDTIKVTFGGQPVTNDRAVYFNGVKNELLANFSSAIGQFQQVIQNYQDSGTAILSLKRILTCRDKMAYDSTAYSTLRTYYQQLAANNLTDTSFANVAGELAVKCLVRLKHYQQAIGEYEDIIANTTDSMKILGCELNIIEIYMMMNGDGDMPGFTGKIAELKPQNIEDGFRLLNEKLRRRSRIKTDNPVPAEFSLSQNYPNPFNALTKINFSLPQSTRVELKVYDILGRLVKVVVNEFKEAGYHSITFDAAGLASGVYFYRIEAGSYIDSKKMVLVK